MIPKAIDQVNEEDIKILKDNAVIERKTLEYKETLPGNTDAEKKEFLADVSSFANAEGGDLIYGISQDKETGAPKLIEGLDINIDEEKQRLENVIRSGLQPRLPSCVIQPVKLTNSNYVIVIRTPRSWISPHRVILGGHDKFYSRNSAGKYPLDVNELRIAFNLSETIAERIRNFKQNRIAAILSGETAVPMQNNPKILLHLVPLISFSSNANYDISKATSPPFLQPIYGASSNRRYNLDGILAYLREGEEKANSYVQLFRNGIIESLDAWMLRSRSDKRLIPSLTFEEKIIESVNNYISLYKSLEVDFPIYLFLTLIGAKGYLMGVDPARFLFSETYPIDRDILQIPEIIIENYNEKPEKLLKPCFDAVWNAAGFARSFNYDDHGNWSQR